MSAADQPSKIMPLFSNNSHSLLVEPCSGEEGIGEGSSIKS